MSSTRCLSLVVVALLAGCASPRPSSFSYPPSQMGETDVRWGSILRISPVQIEGDHQIGVESVIGGVVGGLLGHQIGGGHGRTAATVAGTLLGGYVAGEIKKNSQMQAGQHILVALPSGVSVGITQPVDSSLRVGDAVRIEGSGPNARVIRR